MTPITNDEISWLRARDSSAPGLERIETVTILRAAPRGERRRAQELVSRGILRYAGPLDQGDLFDVIGVEIKRAAARHPGAV